MKSKLIIVRAVVHGLIAATFALGGLSCLGKGVFERIPGDTAPPSGPSFEELYVLGVILMGTLGAGVWVGMASYQRLSRRSRKLVKSRKQDGTAGHEGVGTNR